MRAEAGAEEHRLEAAARADGIRLVEDANVSAERDRMAIYADLSPQVLAGLAAREFAGKLESIEHLSLGADSLSPILSNLFQSSARFLESKAQAAE